MYEIMQDRHGRIQRGDIGSRPPRLKNLKNKGVLCNTGPDPLKSHKGTKPAFNAVPPSARQRYMKINRYQKCHNYIYIIQLHLFNGTIGITFMFKILKHIITLADTHSTFVITYTIVKIL